MKKSYKCQLESLEDRALMSSSPSVMTTHPLTFMPKPSADKAVIAILARTTDNPARSVSIIDADDFHGRGIARTTDKAIAGVIEPKAIPGVVEPHALQSHRLSVDSVFAVSSWEKVELLV